MGFGRNVRALAVLGVIAAGAGTALLLHVVVARLGGTETYATFAVAWAALNLAAVAAVLGYDQLALAVAAGERPLARAFARTAAREVAFLGAAISIAGLLSLAAAGAHPAAAAGLLAVAPAIAAVPLIAATRVLAALVAADGGVLRAIWPERILRDLLILAVVIGVAAMTGGITVLTVFLAAATASAVVLAIMLGQAHARFRLAGGGPLPAVPLPAWRRKALALGLSSFSFQAMQRMPVLLAGILFLPDETARIAAALSVAELAGFPIVAVVAALNPELAAHRRGADVGGLARIHRASIALGFFGGLAAAAVLSALGPFVLSWFAVGAERTLLLVFVFAHVLRSAFGVSTQVLLVCGHVPLVWAGNMVGLATAYGVGVALGPALGPSGLGAALVFGTLASQVFRLGAVMKRLGPCYRAALFGRGPRPPTGSPAD